MTDTTKRTRVQAGIPTGGEFATEARTENDDLEATVAEVQDDFRVVVQAKGKTFPVNLAGCLVSAPEEWHRAMIDDPDRICEYIDNFPENLPDGLTPADMETVDFGSPTSLRTWLKRNPAWVSGSGTPHPTGGYTYYQMHDNGDREYKDEHGQFHRNDGPAAVFTKHHPTGSVAKMYFQHGVLTREGGLPAVERSDGFKQWTVNGEPVAKLDPDGKLTRYGKNGEIL